MAWGSTWDEVVRPLPGDDLIANPLYVTTRAITIDAPAAAVWPWLVQLGQDRGGFYTYDWLENLFRLDIHSADEIHPEWQDPTAGEDCITLDPDGAMKMTFAAVHPGRAFVLRSGAPGEPPQEPGDFFKGEIEITWAFVLEPAGPGARACWRARAPPGATTRGRAWPAACSSTRRTSSWSAACCAGSNGARRLRGRLTLAGALRERLGAEVLREQGLQFS